MKPAHAALLAIGVACGLAVVATAGAPIDIDAVSPDDADATGHLELQPHPGPNGKYAFLDDEGELEVAIGPSNPNVDGGQGVSVESGSTIEDVFTITYNGSTVDRDDPVRVWIEHDDPEGVALTFRSDGRPIEGEDAKLTLDPNETAAVGLYVDTDGAEPGSATTNFTVHAEFPTEPADSGGAGSATTGTRFVVSSPAPNLCEATVYRARGGEPTRLDACDVRIADGVTLAAVTFETSTDDDVGVDLTGSSDPPDGVEPIEAVETGAAPLGYFTADYDATTAAVTERSHEIALEGYDPATVRVYGYDTGNGTWTPIGSVVENAAEHDLNDETNDETDVEYVLRSELGEPDEPDEPDGFSTYAVAVDAPVVRVDGVELGATTVEVGEPATVSVAVANDGRADGTAELVLLSDGEPTASTTLDVPAGGTNATTLEPTFDEPGTYEIAVGNVSAGELTVVAAGTESPSTDAPSTDEPATEGSDGESEEGGTGNGTDAADDGSSTEIDTPAALEEPAGIDLERMAGLVSFLTIVVVTAYLVRRMPRT